MPIADVQKTLERLIAGLYTDCADAERAALIKNPDGTTTVRYQKTIVGMPCRLSRAMTRKQALEETEALSLSEREAVLYYSTEYDILPGDKLTVRREGKSWEFVAGEPHIQHTHCELPIKRVVNA